MPGMTPDFRIEQVSDDKITARFNKEHGITMQHGNVGIDEGAATNPRGAPDPACIYRAFSDDRGGHYLHVSINRNGKIYQRYFPERRCGGEQNAMTLALAWRDNIIAKHPPMSYRAAPRNIRLQNTAKKKRSLWR